MIVATATDTTQEFGPLARLVVKYGELVEQIVPEAKKPGFTADGWGPLAELVAVDQFKRVGAYMEVMNWAEYADFMTQWAGATGFDATIKRISEVGRVVFYEIEEHHLKDGQPLVKNVTAIYVFNDENKIVHLDIYEQAKDTGRWIVEAAAAATKA